MVAQGNKLLMSGGFLFVAQIKKQEAQTVNLLVRGRNWEPFMFFWETASHAFFKLCTWVRIRAFLLIAWYRKELNSVYWCWFWSFSMLLWSRVSLLVRGRKILHWTSFFYDVVIINYLSKCTLMKSSFCCRFWWCSEAYDLHLNEMFFIS